MGSLISGFPSTRLRHLPFFESEGPTTITLIIIAPPQLSTVHSTDGAHACLIQ